MTMEIKLDSTEIRLVERAHYVMQLSGYFSELLDLPGVRFAFTNRFADTWYNQAYDIDWTYRASADLIDLITETCVTRQRTPCVYISPVNKPANVQEILRKSGLVEFEKESWMFFPVRQGSVKTTVHSTKLTIREVTLSRNLDDFCAVYRLGLPGPDVEAYVAAVEDGLRFAPPGVDVRYLVAYLNDQPAGILSVLSTMGCSGIYAVATLPEFRNQGVASSLVSRALEISQAHSSKYLFLQTVVDSTSERAFHAMGFRAGYIRHGFTTAEAVVSMTHG